MQGYLVIKDWFVLHGCLRLENQIQFGILWDKVASVLLIQDPKGKKSVVSLCSIDT